MRLVVVDHGLVPRLNSADESGEGFEVDIKGSEKVLFGEHIGDCCH